MLRIAEQAVKSDTGRQRTANEDAYFVRAPLFAVADGMGGAQAGEVASRIATDTFEPGLDESLPPERRLQQAVEAANHEIHALAERDASTAGMGTTLTVILVGDGEVTLAHVGDSRAYVFRDGRLRQLTQDHSLVEELRRQGRLTEQQAEEHPQRSIITRALGPEAQVDVDTLTFPALHGDVFLLCSDGLTTMIDERRIANIMAASANLEETVGELVAAANEAGGRDNITVVAFRTEEVDAPAITEDVTLVGPAAEAAGFTGDAVREGVAAQSARGGPPIPRRWPRRLVKTLAAIAVLAAVAFGAVYGVRQIYFLGTDDGGRVALYRGLPYELPFGIHLYDERYAAVIQTASLPEARRHTVTDHTLRSRSDATGLVEDLERQAGVRQ